MLNKATGLVRLGVSHAVASAALICGTTALGIILYFVLLLIAIISDQPLGGPLALPFIVVVTLVGSLLAVLVVLMPSTLLGWILRRVVFRHSVWLEIPLSTVISLFITVGVACAIGLYKGESLAYCAKIGVYFWLGLLIPLGVYWWTLRITDVILGACLKLLKIFLGLCSKILNLALGKAKQSAG